MSQEGSPSRTSGPCPSHFSHSHIGAQTGGNVPWRVLVSIRTQAPRSTEGFPASATCWLQICNPPASFPPNCYQAPQDSFVQCVVLFMLLLQQFKQDFCFQFAEWRHLYAILQTLVRVFFFCFDWLFLTCKQTPLRSSKGKDPSRQTSAPHKGRLFMHSHPLWNEEPQLETNKFISPSPME